MEDIEDKYAVRKPKFDGLMTALKFSLSHIIVKKDISLFELDGRVKTLDSIRNKMLRKSYIDPFDDIEDICGLRIVCYYTSDMDAVAELIKEEFHVLEESDKQKEAEDDRFGYLSRHYIVKLKNEWLTAPLYTDYEGLKFEIQLRTMLMHTWAAISHKLLYKKESDAPREVKRRLNRLSALIELADEQFNAIRQIKNEYVAKFESDEGDKNTPLNSDGLILLVNKYSPGRITKDDDIPQFLSEIENYNMTISDFEYKIKLCLPYLDELEEKILRAQGFGNLPVWTIAGYCRTVMDMTSDDYYEGRWDNTTSLQDVGEPNSFWSQWRQLIAEYSSKVKSSMH